MQLSASAIVVAARAHGETASIARVLTEEFGLVAGYVAGGRGRQLRPVLIPGNRVAAELSARSDSQLPIETSAHTNARRLLESGYDLTLQPFDGDHVITPWVVGRAVDFFLGQEAQAAQATAATAPRS